MNKIEFLNKIKRISSYTMVVLGIPDILLQTPGRVKRIYGSTVSKNEGEGIQISYYVLKKAWERWKDIPDDAFIIGVRYKDGDYQLGLSGNAHIGENGIQTVLRELREEVSLTLKKGEKFIKYEKDRNWTFVNVLLQNLYIVEVQEEREGIKSKGKVSIMVYGNYQETLRYLRDVKLNPNNGDSITEVWAIRKSKMMEMISLMTDGFKRDYTRKKKYYFNFV